MLLYISRTTQHAQSSRVIPEVRSRTDTHTILGDRLPEGPGSGWAGIHAEISGIISPLQQAMQRVFHTFQRSSSSPVAIDADRDADPGGILGEVAGWTDSQTCAVGSLVSIERSRALAHALVGGVEAEERWESRADDHTDILFSGDV